MISAIHRFGRRGPGVGALLAVVTSLTVVADGPSIADERVVTGRGTAPPPGNRGSIEMRITPAKARVHLDGVSVGKARDYDSEDEALLVTARVHQIDISRPGYMTLRILVSVQAGRHYVLEHWLREGEGLDPRSMTSGRPPTAVPPVTPPAPPDDGPPAAVPRGRVEIRVTPLDAAVHVDGEFLARARELSRLHRPLSLPVGRHLIEVLRPGYRSERLELWVVEGSEPVRVELELKSALDSP